MVRINSAILILFMSTSMILAGYGYGAPPPQSPTATPEPEPTAADELPIVDDWQVFEVETHGLTISYPSSWIFLDPRRDDPATLLAGRDLPFLAEALRAYGPALNRGVDTGLVGLGYQLHPRSSPELAVANNISAAVIPADGLSLHRLVHGFASYLRWSERVELEYAGVVTDMRARGEEVGSIRFPNDGARNDLPGLETAVWIVMMQSPDAETHLMLRFQTLSDEFDRLEPLLTEIVRRVHWAGPPDGRSLPVPEQPDPLVVEVNRTTSVRSGPSQDFPVIGTATSGQQLVSIRLDPTGAWRLIDDNGQFGWVPAQSVIPVSAQHVQVTADLPTPSAAAMLPVVTIHNPFAPPVGNTRGIRQSVMSEWPVFEEEAHGLSIFYPAGWLFFDSDQPTPADLAALSAALGEQVAATDIGQLTPVQIDRQEPGSNGAPLEALPAVWLGFQLAAMPHNHFLASSVPADGLTLDQLAQRLITRLYTDPNPTIEIGSAALVAGLRPQDEEVISLRYRTNDFFDDQPAVVVWRIAMLSPDSESLFTFDFFIRGDDFAELEPLLREIVWRMRWAGQAPPESLAGPTVTVNQTMNVREGPGTHNPIIGTATAGQQFPILGQNAAGDWWQIEYGPEGAPGIGWVFGGLVTATGDTQTVRRVDPSGWLEFDSGARGLTLSYPSEWFFFNPTSPAPLELAAISAQMGGPVDAAEVDALVTRLSGGQEDAVIGLGLQYGQGSSNFVLALAYAAEGLTLARYAQLVAAELEREGGIPGSGLRAIGGATAEVELVTDMRAQGEEVVTIRYREDGSLYEVRQVWLLSPDGETLLTLAFSIHGDEMAAMEPLFVEMARRVRWAAQTDAEQSAAPVVTVNRTTYVRAGPGTNYPVIGTAAAGQ